ncbi:MucBP domain-containing protein, partial [Streptococcus sp. 121]|uniref:mucin-binding protein n=1 Tax=Streptococcus sp. 121 TaxID=2797637 RepID=UPI0018F077D1
MKGKHKKKFDWYSMKKRYSFRKYHFGLASVLLGTTLLTGQVAQAEEVTSVAPSATQTVASSEATEVVSSPIVEEAGVSETSATASQETAEATLASSVTTEAIPTTESSSSTEVSTSASSETASSSSSSSEKASTEDVKNSETKTATSQTSTASSSVESSKTETTSQATSTKAENTPEISQATEEKAETSALSGDFLPTTTELSQDGLVKPLVDSFVKMSWQAIPRAEALLLNAKELLESRAKIAYAKTPQYGDRQASILVTYENGETTEVNFDVHITSQAVRRNRSNGSTSSDRAFRADSPNTSGTVNGAIGTSNQLENNQATTTITVNGTLDISGESANYDGGYVEIVFENSLEVTPTPSTLTGVTITTREEGNNTIVRFTPTNPLRGGSYYNFVTTFKLDSVNNWGATAAMLEANDFKVPVKATFYDADGLKVQDLGQLSFGFEEVYNAADAGTAMSNGQIVGTDTNNNGIVDAGETGKVTFYVYTGARTENGTSVLNDFWSPGTGVFDGRHVTGGGTTAPSNRIIAPVTTYTYDIAKKAGLTLSQESKDAGWVEDENGYHLTVTPETNPLVGDNTSNRNNAKNLVPLSFDIVEGASVADVKGAQTLTITGTYTKEDGSTYSNTQNLRYNVDIPATPTSQGILSLRRDYISDTEIIKAHGETTYRTNVDLTAAADTDKDYPMDGYTIRVTTDNEGEFFKLVRFDGRNYAQLFEDGGSLEVYDDATGELLGEFNSSNYVAAGTLVSIDESKEVKTLRYTFKNVNFNKDSSEVYPPNSLKLIETTFYNNWSERYNDSSVTELPSKTTVTLTNEDSSVTLSDTKEATLTRKIYEVNMNERSDVTFNNRTGGSGFTQSYTITDTELNNRGGYDSRTLNEVQMAGYTENLYQAYLLDPNIVIMNNDWTVYYNFNGTGKDLYVENNPVTASKDPINQLAVAIANQYVPNGSYEITQIGFWSTKDPGLIPTDGIDLGTVTVGDESFVVTSENSTSSTWKVHLVASESSGVLSKVKPDSATSYGFNSNQHEAQDVVDFEITYSNVATQELMNVSVITSLPREGDKQLDSRGNARNSQFDVYLTKEVTPPSGWRAVYTTTTGTAAQMEAGTWLEAADVTDWSSITAVKFVSTGPVSANSNVDFHIEDAVIGTNATQGERAYLSSASTSGGSTTYIESNNVLIQMKNQIADGTVTINYVDENGNAIPGIDSKSVTNDVKSEYDVSNKDTYYPDSIFTADGLEYEYVETKADSAPNTGVFTEEEQTITHVYKLAQQTANFTYKDVTDADNPSVLDTVDSVTGDSAAVIDYQTADRIIEYLKKGYELVSNDFEDGVTTYDKDKAVDQDFTIELKQRVVPITDPSQAGTDVDEGDENTPQYPDSVKELESLTKTVTRTIEYKYLTEDGEEASATVTQTVEFKRTATVNLVTGEIVYTEWTTEEGEGTKEAVKSPDIAGYTPDKASVAEWTPKPTDENVNEVVIYTPDKQEATVTYVDITTGDEVVLGEVDSLTGVTDAKIDYSTADRIAAYIEEGYELVEDGFPAGEVYDKDGNVTQEYKVTLRQKVVDVDPENPTNPKDNSELELTKTVTRTIEYKYLTEDGEEASKTVTQTVTFTRTAKVNMVTGEVTYAAWTTEEGATPAVESPAIAGYTPDQAIVAEWKPSADDEDVDVVVVYTPNDQKATITYVDETTGETLDAVDTVTGKSDESIKYTTAERIAAYEKAGYVLVSDNFPVNGAVYDRDDATDQAYTVVLKHKIEDIDPENPVNPNTGDPVELTKTITRTIEYKYLTPTGEEASATITQTVEFTRTATVDRVTGEVTYTDWTTEEGTVPEVESPAIAGYTPDQASVAEWKPSADDEDVDVVVVYTPNDQKATITYVDENTGETLDAVDTVTGKSDESIKYTTAERIAAYEKAGYVLVSDDFPVNGAIYDRDDATDQAYTVVLKHKIEDIDPENPVNPNTGDPVELTKTVTRTIEYKYLTEDGEEASATITQTVEFTRTAIVDRVTGEVTYTDWTTEEGTVPAVVSPAIAGYTPDQAIVA